MERACEALAIILPSTVSEACMMNVEGEVESTPNGIIDDQLLDYQINNLVSG